MNTKNEISITPEFPDSISNRIVLNLINWQSVSVAMITNVNVYLHTSETNFPGYGILDHIYFWAYILSFFLVFVILDSWLDSTAEVMCNCSRDLSSIKIGRKLKLLIRINPFWGLWDPWTLIFEPIKPIKVLKNRVLENFWDFK